MALESAVNRLVGAGDDFDEGGFAGAVFAQERMDLACLQVERDAFESPHRAEGFRNVCQLEQNFQTANER